MVKPSKSKRYKTQFNSTKKTLPKARKVEIKTVQPARPKTGTHYYPHSVSLTLEQIEFLSKQPNASELVRKIIDDLIKVQNDVEAQFPFLTLRHEIELVESQIKKVESERQQFMDEHFKDMYETGWVIPEKLGDDSYSKELRERADFYSKRNQSYLVILESFSVKLKELRDKFMKIDLTIKQTNH